MQFEERLKKYLRKKSENDWSLINNPGKEKYDSFIVVPAKAELNSLPILLESISKQDSEYLKNCLVVIVFNRSVHDSKEIYNNNKQSMNYVKNINFNFDICYIDANSSNNLLPKKNAGVGLARKIGADLILSINFFRIFVFIGRNIFKYFY